MKFMKVFHNAMRKMHSASQAGRCTTPNLLGVSGYCAISSSDCINASCTLIFPATTCMAFSSTVPGT